MFGTNKLEFPLIRDGKILVNDGFLKEIVKVSNKNLEKSWKQIKDLSKKV
jgi:tRNA(Phe) wybutosine-synthesizing methylase Tyw3